MSVLSTAFVVIVSLFSSQTKDQVTWARMLSTSLVGATVHQAFRMPETHYRHRSRDEKEKKNLCEGEKSQTLGMQTGRSRMYSKHTSGRRRLYGTHIRQEQSLRYAYIRQRHTHIISQVAVEYIVNVHQEEDCMVLIHQAEDDYGIHTPDISRLYRMYSSGSKFDPQNIIKEWIQK